MSDVITTGVFTLLGTAIGAGITQVGPVASGISQRRQERAKAARELARSRADTQRPLYLDLITLVSETVRHIGRLHADDADAGQALGGLRQAIAANIDSISALCTKMKVDGSDRAKDIAAKLMTDIGDLAEDLDLDLDLDAFTEGSIGKALAGLKEAEVKLVSSARADVGSQVAQSSAG